MNRYTNLYTGIIIYLHSDKQRLQVAINCQINRVQEDNQNVSITIYQSKLVCIEWHYYIPVLIIAYYNKLVFNWDTFLND